MKNLFLFLAIVGLSACGSTAIQFYDGPSKSSNETATISLWTDASKLDEEFSPSALQITSLKLNDKDIVTNSDISILAGEYSFTTKCTIGSFSKTSTFNFDASSNKNYAVKAVGQGKECYFKKLSLLVDNSRFVEL
ncbi:conserved exported hypothetical protein [Alteromonas sp. 38]|uniref:hypothetical protein n=1 Tax=unclassified Alteromonas TaxID=2614992 RepID=UPI0012EF888A|nr:MULTISPECIES: hypothetical protein [unclassified Alteromonas]CAD5292345.1 conserved exported hypothetical protein [Alteromonas sp. 154]VXB15414.1 conserved exported hypothetical protein [Alteromonas sp. 38]